MTSREHSYAIKEIMEKGLSTQSFTISLRLILHFLKVARQKLLREKMDKYYSLSTFNFQTLCVDLSSSSFHQCCDKPDAGCKIMKSKTKIPNLVSARFGDYFKVMTINGELIPQTTVTTNKYSKYSLTDSKPARGYFVNNGHLYVINDDFIETVLLSAIFEDPEKIEEYNCHKETTEKCGDYLDTTFPIEGDLIWPMYQLTLKIMEPTLVIRQDHEKQTETT